MIAPALTEHLLAGIHYRSIQSFPIKPPEIRQILTRTENVGIQCCGIKYRKNVLMILIPERPSG
jgi:hypothetical protein